MLLVYILIMKSLDKATKTRTTHFYGNYIVFPVIFSVMSSLFLLDACARSTNVETKRIRTENEKVGEEKTKRNEQIRNPVNE